MHRILILLAISMVLAAAAARADAAPSDHLSGVATYADDGRPAVGVEVYVDTVVPPGQNGRFYRTLTDTTGHWDYGPLPVGSYEVVFSVRDDRGSNWTEGHVLVDVTTEPQTPLVTALSGGPHGIGLGTLAGTVTFASGPAPRHTTITVTADGDPDQADATGAQLDAAGRFSMILPPGSYVVAMNNIGEVNALTGSVPATVVSGEVTTAQLTLPALPVTPGAVAARSSETVAFLNQERARWGLPADIAESPVWSLACASHNAWMELNDHLGHEESGPGFSSGGNWAGTHSVLSLGSPWTAEANPWEDAPIHLVQLFTPDLSTIGVSENAGYDCATTWPGMLGPRAPASTVFTYPGDGTSGLPPAEDAREGPFVPGDFVGLPSGTIAGRELFVYQESGAENPTAIVESASLADATGRPVAIKWVDTTTPEVGSFLTGAILIPVAPLAPFTTYTATVALGAHDDVAATTHRWSFTTGAANPDGRWPTTARRQAPSFDRTRPLRLSHVRMTHRRFRVAPLGGRAARSVARGTAFRFRLSGPGRVSIAFARGTPGRRRSGACVPVGSPGARPHGPRCTRFSPVGRLVAPRGSTRENRVAFSGHLGSRALLPGRYRATLSARGAHGLSNGVNVRFVVLPPVSRRSSRG